MCIDQVNGDFYNTFGDSFDKIPFDEILPDLVHKYAKGKKILEIGSGSGALAVWLTQQGFKMTCVEPAVELAKKAQERGLIVHATTFKQFHSSEHYDDIFALSSLIHIPKIDLPKQIEKLAKLLCPKGILFLSLIEGKEEGFEDPTQKGKIRYFAKWTETELDALLSPTFIFLENHKIYHKKMDRNFLLKICQKRS